MDIDIDIEKYAKIRDDNMVAKQTFRQYYFTNHMYF